MITSFEFDNVEAAYYIGGVRRAVSRRVPKYGHVYCYVRPLTKGGRVMKNRRSCCIKIYAGIDGKPPYAYVLGNSTTARDLYQSLGNDGFAVDWIY